MKCTHPLVAIDLNEGWKKAEKKDLKFIPHPNIDDIVKHQRIDYEGKLYHPIILPCGKCIACRINKASEWAQRIMLEAKYHPQDTCWFTTFTYNDDNLVYVDDTDGAVRPTLVPEHLTKLIKDIRRYYEYHYNHSGIRFYAVGEYGDLYLRPHFHIIFFNLPLYDKKYFTVRNKAPVYHVPDLDRCWKKGFIEVTPLTYDNAAYAARYTQKKVNGFITKVHYGNLTPEFLRMSRRPGIGRVYYDEHKEEMFATDEIHIIGRKGKVQTVKPAKYYNGLFEAEFPHVYPFIKDKRMEDMYNADIQFRKQTDKPYSQYLESLEESYYNKAKKLKRPLEKERS